MKKLLYIFVLMLIGTFARAQRSVNYVSFFPPANIIHSDIELIQDSTSFNFNSENSGNTHNYHSKRGGFVLGAAPNAKVTIDGWYHMTPNKTTDPVHRINAHNLVEVRSKAEGSYVTYVTAGTKCNTSNSAECEKAVLSIYKLKFPLDNEQVRTVQGVQSYVSEDYPAGLTVNVKSSNIADVEGLYLYSNTQDNITYFSRIIPPLSSGQGMKWVNLRLKGTEECRRYLVRYTGTEPGDNCFEPGT